MQQLVLTMALRLAMEIPFRDRCTTTCTWRAIWGMRPGQTQVRLVRNFWPEYCLSGERTHSIGVACATSPRSSAQVVICQVECFFRTTKKLSKQACPMLHRFLLLYPDKLVGGPRGGPELTEVKACMTEALQRCSSSVVPLSKYIYSTNSNCGLSSSVAQAQVEAGPTRTNPIMQKEV